MPDTVKIYLDLPRMITAHGGEKTKGKPLTLTPDPDGNVVDRELYEDKVRGDWLIQHLRSEGAIREDGEFRRAVSDDVIGIQNPAIPSVDLKPGRVNVVDPKVDHAPNETIKPKRMGGAVPGNVDEARELITVTDDAAQLNQWLDSEPRVKVKRALRARLGEISADGN